MLGLEPWPKEEDVEARLANDTLPKDPDELNALVWPLVDPDDPVFGDEVKALLLARRAVAAASEDSRAGFRDSLAWAHLRLGRFGEGLQEERRALAEAPSTEAEEYTGYIAKMESIAERWRGDTALAQRRKERDVLLAEAAELDRIVSEPQSRDFEHPEDGWWHAELAKLVSDLDALRDPKRGLMANTLAEPFGWGVTKRYEFAKTIQDRSINGFDARQRWETAIAAIAASPKYAGLKLTPQLGLLPISEDPESKLWEFAHLETGEPAVRGADGKLVLTEETGLVFVLIPTGTFWMGAQHTDPTGRNFDPMSGSDEAPVHEVQLTAYFFSKYEMTQGQWQRVAARNPSHYPAGRYSRDWNRARKSWTSLHPVEQVSWDDCMALLARVELELPTEAQWEYGARAGTSTVFWTGDDVQSLAFAANLSDAYGRVHDNEDWSEWEPDLDDGNTVHAEIGSYRANAFGLHDVHGNVWEWCLDGHDNGFYLQTGFYGKVASIDPVRPPTSSPDRVYRGGSFSYAAVHARSAYRSHGPPGYRDYNLGLRPARRVEL